MQIKTKFNIGDNVWYMKKNKPTEIIISAIETFNVDIKQSIRYNAKNVINPVTWLDNTNLQETLLFKTKQELLNSL